jgi:branched-chain amino acid transport system substrate-binding protein
MQFFLFLPLILSLFTISACSPNFEDMAEKRVKFAQQNKDDIEIVAIQDLKESNYLKGVLLAKEEINKGTNKLLGRKLKINIMQEGETIDDVQPLLRRIASNPRITAVLGHRRSSIALPASVIYERSQIIFMPSFSVSQSLTGHNFQYVFRMAPNADVMTKQLASVASNLGYKKIVILYSRDELNRELAFLFEDASIKQGIKLIKRASFFEKESNYRSIISQFNNKKFDAIFIASGSRSGGVMVKQLREMGVRVPILGSDTFAHPHFIESAGSAAKNTIVPTIYKLDDEDYISNKFVKNYRDKYQKDPDYTAAQGYDSVMLLASAIRRAGSVTPSLLSSTLHYSPAWVGVTGIHAFDSSGEVLGKKYLFKTWKKQQWVDLPAIYIPYLLDKFYSGLKDTATDFTAVFSKRIHIDDHKINLLDLAQEIFKFNKLGIIYENTKLGRKAADYNLISTLAKQKNIDIIPCEIPFSILSTVKIEQEMIICFGKLSLNIDALYLPSYDGINNKLLKKLTSGLAFFKIPAISLNEHNTDSNVSLLLESRSDVTIDTMQVYNGLLNGLKVHEFREHLKNLPQLTFNLENLHHNNFPDKPVLQLSPDLYLHANGVLSKESVKP